jgi:hypothetical protein
MAKNSMTLPGGKTGMLKMTRGAAGLHIFEESKPEKKKWGPESNQD